MGANLSIFRQSDAGHHHSREQADPPPPYEPYRPYLVPGMDGSRNITGELPHHEKASDVGKVKTVDDRIARLEAARAKAEVARANAKAAYDNALGRKH